MIGLKPGTRVHLSCRTIDLRKGFNGLTALVANTLNADPFNGHLFVFRGKRGDYLKAIYWDGSGLCLFAKRLENGTFVWPPVINECLSLTPAQFALLVEGMDWRRTVPPLPVRQPIAV
ncbi:MAG: IS66 family insertion sequence element accessory protein TnpB [Rhodomicrobium sp.]